MEPDDARGLTDELARLATELRDMGGNHLQLYRLAELTVKHLDACCPALEQAQAEVAQAQRALDSCRDIGVALGVLMTKRGVDREAALAVLRRASQHSHVKLRDVAVDYLRTGSLPEIGRPRRVVHKRAEP